MTYSVKVLKEGYSSLSSDGKTMKANCTCTLVVGPDVKIVVDPLTAWDKEYLLLGLKNNGLSFDEINYVICTHGHSDHIGNLNLFLHATHIVGFSISHKDVYTLHPFDEGKEFEIDSNIKVIPTPGHTLSDVSIVVKNTAQGTVVIAGDLFEREDDIADPQLWREIAGSENQSLQLDNRQHILDLADYIIPGHGPQFKVTDAMREKHRTLMKIGDTKM